MTEREALTEIKELICQYWATDPAYYTNSENTQEAEAAKLCCCINEIITNAEEECEAQNSQKDMASLK